MNRKLLPLIIVCAAALVVSAGKSTQPDPSVNFAKSWDAAVEEAKLLNVPIVAHSHGFN